MLSVFARISTQTEELKRNALQDMELTKYRESLLTSHSLEIEKINDRHRNEMKKYHVSEHTCISIYACLSSACALTKLKCARAV